MEPAKISATYLLRRSLKLLPLALKTLLFPLLVGLGFPFLVGFCLAPSGLTTFVLSIVVFVVSMALGFYLYVGQQLIVLAIWRGETTSWGNVHPKITFNLCWRLIVCSSIVGFGAVMWAIAFIVPGIVYSLNRVLSPLLIMDRGMVVKEAIEHSKLVMSRQVDGSTSPKWLFVRVGTSYVGIVFIFQFVITMFIGSFIAMSTGGAVDPDRVTQVGSQFGYVLSCILTPLFLIMNAGFYDEISKRYSDSSEVVA